MNISPLNCTYLRSPNISVVTTKCKKQGLLKIEDYYCAIFLHIYTLCILLMFSHMFFLQLNGDLKRITFEMLSDHIRFLSLPS